MGKLRGVAVCGRVHLQHACLGGHHGGHVRALERAGRGHDSVGLDRPRSRLNTEAALPDLPVDLQNLDSAPDRRRNLLRVSHQIVCNGVLKWKIVWPNALVDIAEGETWKAVVPRGTVRYQRVPSFRAPALSDPVPLENEVRHAVHAQM